MKTAISVPDEVFAQVVARAAALGISRSEFFARGARRYLEELESESLTTQVNEALDLIGEGGDDTYAVVAAYNRMRLAELTEDDDW